MSCAQQRRDRAEPLEPLIGPPVESSSFAPTRMKSWQGDGLRDICRGFVTWIDSWDCADAARIVSWRRRRNWGWDHALSGAVQEDVCSCAGFWTPAMMRCLPFRRPASKKRQGTKSREVWRRLCCEGYGDLIFAPAMMVGAMPAPGDLHGCAQGSLAGCNGHLGGRVDRIDGRSAR